MAATASPVDTVAGVLRFRDTCNVYALRSGREAVLVDFGSGAVLDHLDALEVDRVTDVLVTHHHRDQVQGLRRAVDAGIRVWVPPYEEELIAGADEHWRVRKLGNDYDLRQDRFSLLASVPVAGTVDEYRTRAYGGVDVHALPTPGHTVGSVTYLVDVDGRRVGFSGDLVHSHGKVWSLAATQWSYSGVEGQAATIVSCETLSARSPDVLLPSHGDAIDEPGAALTAVADRVQELISLRLERPWDIREWHHNAWQPVTPHLLRDRSSFATSYALVSETGAALLVDWGYHVATGVTPSTERTARRPLLASIDVLRAGHGIDRVEAVITTHYHDDHVAGLNVLRDVHGTEVWSPANVAPILEDPRRFDLPCLWWEPIPVDRVLELGGSIRWHEYELTVHPLPGHTRYAAAIAFEVDGRRVVATGDQLAFGSAGAIPNYQYRNRFSIDDYVDGAALLAELRPDLVVSGHWLPHEVTDDDHRRWAADGQRVAELHRALLPLDEVDFGAEGAGARVEPYHAQVAAGGEVAFEVEVRNPFDRDAPVELRLVLPDGWAATPETGEATLGPHGETRLSFAVRVGDEPVRRARLAAELTVAGVPFGQQAEALVDVG